MLIAVFGGIALNTLLKAAFERPRPDIVIPAARVSFPSGHASVSAITYLTIGA
jgi:undecaprenyl-diphosphatase